MSTVRIELAAPTSKVAGRTLSAADVGRPAPGQPRALGAKFSDYGSYGSPRGNGLVLRTYLRREPRKHAAFIDELGRQ